jgi:hypothetical protein
VRVLVAAGVVLALVGGAVGVKLLLTPTPSPPLGCTVTGTTYTLDFGQAANVTTIAAVGKRLGLPDHAVTVALAAALQESRLHNLSYGDRDSRGVFQQRPSQGWGTAEQVMTPRYAAAAFFQHLSLVPRWPTLPVTVAAQQVQRSGSPNAYAQWEDVARSLARATTGEVAAGLSCRVPDPPAGTASRSLSQAMTLELGDAALGVPVSAPRGWTVATWLVAHATEFGITAVSFAGQQWTSASGEWQPGPSAAPVVRVTRTTATH